MAEDRLEQLDEEEEWDNFILESRMEEFESLCLRDVRDYVILEAGMQKLEFVRQRTVARWFWGSAAIGAVLGIIFGFERATNKPEMFQPVWLSSLIFCVVFAIFAGLPGYLLGQAVGMIRYRRDRRLAISPEALQRYRDFQDRGYWYDKLNERIGVIRERTYVGSQTETDWE